MIKTPGLELARLADLPADVLSEAKRVATSLAALDAQQKEQSRTARIAERRKALLTVLLSSYSLPPSHPTFRM